MAHLPQSSHSVSGGPPSASSVPSVLPSQAASQQGLSVSSLSQQAVNQQGFQRLKVEDALSYLDQVKFKFNNQPQVYNDFLDIMKEFKSQSIDTPGVIQRVSNLFRGHPELIVGFNTFLPPGYKIEMQSNDQVNVSMPSSTSILIIQNSNPNMVTTNPQVLLHSSSAPPQVAPIPISHHPSVQITSNAAPPGPHSRPLGSAPSQPYLHGINTASAVRSVPTVDSHHGMTQVAPIHISPHQAVQITSSSGHQGPLSKPLGPTSSYLHGVNATAARAVSGVDTHHALPLSTTTHISSGNTPSSDASLLSASVSASIITPSAEGVSSHGVGSRESGDIGTTGGISAASCTSGPGGDSNQSAAQPVEFNHAINYVNKIKNRFQGQPEIYKQFLDILHAYQKEQKSLKDGIKTDGKPLNESHVYAQVAKLFQNQEDLLQEFGQFLPDANAAAVNASNTMFSVSHDGLNSSSHHLSHHGSASGSTISTALSAAHHVDNLAAAHRAAFNDHGVIVKKPLARPGGPGVITSGLNTTSATQIKRPLTNIQSSSSSSSINKPKMTSLRDVSVAEAGKYGSLKEYSFFDQVRHALRSREVYENFLRCLFLYNNEILSRNELVLLVTPFLGKFPELFRFFKDFLGYKENSSNSSSYPNFQLSSSNNSNNVYMEGLPQRVARERERERINSEVTGMEIDYASCKRYGASYRALPKNYVQPECSGRTPLCKEVLNDAWVSFPSWSEDSTFVTSKKTQYEEFIYRCEDERFELDVVIETNLSTIRVLEAVQKRLNRMTPDERSRFKLDDCLGGTSAIIHQRSIRRIYGDKAQEIIEGLKKNPSVAVPLVLRRLKAKEEEWKEAQNQFNKIWREQSEKYYLKSLDHQGISFKQNDIKYLRSKSLLNEIETCYEERHEQNEENMAAAGEGTGNNNSGQNINSGPHMTLHYKNKAMIEEACNLIIHHVKRQTSIHKEDKQKIKQLLRHFIPDLFATPRGELSDDEIEDFEIDNGKRIPNNGDNEKNKSESAISLQAHLNDVDAKGGKKAPDDSKANGSSKLPKTETSLPERFNGDAAGSETSDKTINPVLNVDPDDSYVLFFVNNHWYLFFRLHHILCDRLGQMTEKANILIAEEEKEKKLRKESTAAALRLKPKNDYEVEEYFPALIEMVKQVLDGNLDFNQYEDQLREMFGIHAYIAFTLDKVVQNIVRQLQHIVCDEKCIQCTEMFIEETKNGATGGCCSTHHLRAGPEASYQKRAEQLLTDDNCFKIIICKNEGKLTIELIVTESPESEDGDGGEVDKWTEYVEKYVSEVENDISDELKERFAKKPVFLPRNIRMSRHKAKEKAENEEKDKEKDSVHIMDDTQCKFNVNSYKMVFVVQSESYLYKTSALAKARRTHKQVSSRLSEKFNRFHQTWLDKNVTKMQSTACLDWLSYQGAHSTNSADLPEDKEDKDVEMKDESTAECRREPNEILDSFVNNTVDK